MHTPSTRVTYRFGEFALDTVTYELRRSGDRIRLARQPMDLLLLLLERPGELVSREVIGSALWTDDVFVDREAGMHTAVLKIRQALGDSTESPHFVETVPGRGYRIVASVEVVAHAPLQGSAVHSPALEPLPSARRHNLPAELTSFVGRRKELVELPGLIASSRLLSLTGAGGVGKTRLAVRLASGLPNEFSDGVWLVDLAPLSVPDLVAQTIATSLGVRESPSRSIREALLEHVRDRELLLVLDTCEHLVGACAAVAETLLRGAPGLRIVATSRESLGVPGEIVYRVPSLSLPDERASGSGDAAMESEATQLFIERAITIDTTFRMNPDNAETIVRICRRLDGIPLAIELAAARILILSPEQLEARLEHRFRLLTGGARTAVARQRTLEATVEWSYQLLSDTERLLLCRLSVFPASWTLEAAEAVCGGDPIDDTDMVELLSRLVGKSLLAFDGRAGGERRYRMLESVRQYARDRLVEAGVADDLRERHFAVFFNEFRGVLRVLRGPDQVPCLRRLRSEQENVRAALEWALASTTRGEDGVELAGGLFWYWTMQALYEEGRYWLERAVAVRASALLQATVWIGVAHMHYFQGRHVEAAAAGTMALSLCHESGEAGVTSRALFMQALTAFELGDHPQASARALAALEEADASSEPVDRGGPLMILANVALMTGDLDRAQQLYDESIEVHRRAGESWGLSILLSIAAGLCTVRDDFDQARLQAAEALSLCEELDDPRGLAWSLDVFAGLLAAGGHADGAARLWGASDALLESVGGSLVPTIGWIRDRYIEPMRALLGDGPFATIRAQGRAMLAAHAIALAREQALLLP